MNISLVDIQLPSARREEGQRLAREPIGILELGAFLRDNCNVNINYVIVDKDNFSAEKILINNPEVIGFSTYSYNYNFAVDLAQNIKLLDPSLKIVFGGPHAGSIPDIVYVEQKNVIDAVIAGEGELGMLDFLQNVSRGVIRKNRVEINNIPVADRLESLLDNSNFRVLNNKEYKTAVVLTSRGCTRSCDFCISRKTRLKLKSYDIVLKEIEMLRKEYDVKVIIFEDPLLNGNLQYLDGFCDKLISEKERGNLGDDFYAIGMCDFSFGRDSSYQLQKMRKAGFIQINWGIEDPRQEYRLMFNKKIPLQKDILEKAHEAGIYNRGLLMLPINIGAINPEVDIRLYGEALAHLKLDEVKVNVTTPFPGTPFYDSLMRNGRLREVNWNKYDTHHLVFDAGEWTQEVIESGRKYIVEEFERLKRK